MACCKCCCENGTPPGECCGSPSTCCKEPDVCCGPSGSKECCEDPRVCCGVGSGQECCPEGDECCGEECCPPSQECCGEGESQVCCNEGQYCCDGECKQESCVVCEPCDDCSWPSDRSESGRPAAGGGCPNPWPLNTVIRSQTLSQTLPPAVQWAAGYPAALSGCNWRWCRDRADAQCKWGDGPGCTLNTKTRYKLLVLKCDGSVNDITDQAATGTFEAVSGNPLCPSAPSFPAYFGSPVPDCPP
jgi:hypothetical protein